MIEKNYLNLVDCYIRAKHYFYSNIKVYNDEYAYRLLYMLDYSKFDRYFNLHKDKLGTNYIGNVLCRWAFKKRVLDNCLMIGVRQYVVVNCLYDTTTINKNIKCFEIDKKINIIDKVLRLDRGRIESNNIKFISNDLESDISKLLIDNGFNKDINTLVSFNYMKEVDIYKNLSNLSHILCSGSSVVFSLKNINSLKLESNLSKLGYRIYEILIGRELEEFLYKYNTINPNIRLSVSDDLVCVLAVKK